MTEASRIQIDAGVCHGRPIIRGTRIPVAVIVGSLASGMGMDQIAYEYGVSEQDIRAALSFANELIQQESFHSLPNTVV